MKYILPVIAGLATIIVTGLVLYPVVNIIFDRFFHLYLFTAPPANRWKDDLVVWITVVAWFFISSATGGFVCSYLSKQKEDFSILLLLVISFLIMLILTEGKIISDFEIVLLLPALSFIFGTCTGNYFNIKRGKRKIINNESSPPDTP